MSASTLSDKQREVLVRLASVDGPDTMLPFAAGTISSLRKLGLIDRVRVASSSTKSGRMVGYVITDRGKVKLEGGS